MCSKENFLMNTDEEKSLDDLKNVFTLLYTFFP